MLQKALLPCFWDVTFWRDRRQEQLLDSSQWWVTAIPSSCGFAEERAWQREPALSSCSRHGGSCPPSDSLRCCCSRSVSSRSVPSLPPQRFRYSRGDTALQTASY